MYAFDIQGTFHDLPNPPMWVNFLRYANPNNLTDHAGNIDRILKDEFNGEIVHNWRYRRTKRFHRKATSPIYYVRFASEKDFIMFKLRWDGA